MNIEVNPSLSSEGHGHGHGTAVSFHSEIAMMMHGLGDSSTPNPHTVALVESVLLHQMRQALAHARKAADRRGHRQLAPEHLFYLMRNNKVKLRRMLHYMKSASIFKSGRLAGAGLGRAFLAAGGVTNVDDKFSKLYAEPAAVYLEGYGCDLDDEEDGCGYGDPVLAGRRKRAAALAETLPLDKYLAFQKARRVRLGRAKDDMSSRVRMEKWLSPDEELEASPATFDLIAYLCKETVAQIVDMAFRVRQDSKALRNDPFARFRGGNCCNPATLADSQIAKTGNEGVPPITVGEVREAVRRFTFPRIGPAGLHYRNIESEPPPRLFAL